MISPGSDQMCENLKQITVLPKPSLLMTEVELSFPKPYNDCQSIPVGIED